MKSILLSKTLKYIIHYNIFLLDTNNNLSVTIYIFIYTLFIYFYDCEKCLCYVHDFMKI